MTLSEQLAERLLQIEFAALPPEAIHWAKVSILDTLGVALAGASDPCARIAGKVVGGGTGGSLVFGTARRVAPLDAAMINGTAAHALDFDASNDTFAGHPSVHILPALFAAAEMANADGAAFVAAYVAGFELQCRIARGVQPHQSDLGWFPSSSVGVLGAAAAVAHLLRLDIGQTAQALGLAANLASGFMANAGTMTKPLAAGQSARNGLLAALLVQDGFTASLGALEDRRGFLTLFSGAGAFDTDSMLPKWGAPYEVLETAIGLKRHPCCGVLQAAIDVMGDLVAQDRLTPDAVERVDALLVTKRFGHVDRPDPRSGTDAKFSVQYCVARTLEHGRLEIGDFEDGAYRDATTRVLMQRVVGGVHDSVGPQTRRDQQGGAEIRVTLRNGHIVSGFAQKPFGRVAGAPLPEPMLHAKFLDCAGRALTGAGAAQLLEQLHTVETIPRVQSLADLMLQTSLSP